MPSLRTSMHANTEYDYIFKLVLAGAPGSGKTSIIRRFTDDAFQENYCPTIGVDFSIKTIMVKGKTVKLQIWDTAGLDRFRTLVSSYYRGCHGVILIYDITSNSSFKELDPILNDIVRMAQPEIEKIIVGNKCDLQEQRQVDREAGEQFASNLQAHFLETSAKTAENVTAVFETLAADLIDLHHAGSLVGPNDSIRLEEMNTRDTEAWSCCGYY